MIETKLVYMPTDPFQREATMSFCKRLESFGWTKEKLEERQEGRIKRTYGVLVRDKDKVPNLEPLNKLQEQLEELLPKLKANNEFEVGRFIGLFLLLVLPGLIYLIANKIENNSINDYNNRIYAKMDELTEAAKRLLNDK